METAERGAGKTDLRRTRRSTIAAALTAAVLSIGIVAVASGASEGGDPVVDAAVVASISTPNGGYRLVTDKGGVYAFGGASFAGSMAGLPLQAPVVAGAGTPDGNGYWLTAADGGVFAFGSARFLGNMRNVPLQAPIVGIAATADGAGYWLTAADGGVFAFGSARFLGNMRNVPLQAPIVGIAATADGAGYWLTAADGGVFAFGSARFLGNMRSAPLQAPIVGIAATADGAGYWLTAADGGVFAFGSARFLGSGRGSVVAPVASIAATGTPASLAYRLITADGGVYNYGSARYAGRVVYRAQRPFAAGNTTDIPADYMALYRAAAPTCSGLPWEVLAGIGSIETNHGRSRLPGVHSGSNYAGAKGPMQFLQATFDGYAVDGDGDGIKDVYDPADAIFSAAHYLCANGAGDTNRLWHAIYQYNHADWYVDQVLRQATAYGWNEPSGVRPTT